MAEKKNIAVIFGGESSEYEISLISSSFVIDNIDKEKYNVYTIGITKDGAWYLYDGSTENIKNGAWVNDENNKGKPPHGDIMHVNNDLSFLQK